MASQSDVRYRPFYETFKGCLEIVSHTRKTKYLENFKSRVDY